MGGKDLSFCVGSQAPSINKSVSEEEKMLGKSSLKVVVQRNVKRH